MRDSLLVRVHVRTDHVRVVTLGGPCRTARSTGEIALGSRVVRAHCSTCGTHRPLHPKLCISELGSDIDTSYPTCSSLS
ncbi:MAG: hypothetical protein ACK55I_03235 [bacterium]